VDIESSAQVQINSVQRILICLETPYLHSNVQHIKVHTINIG